jgi:hypothetical protein
VCDASRKLTYSLQSLCLTQLGLNLFAFGDVGTREEKNILVINTDNLCINQDAVNLACFGFKGGGKLAQSRLFP